MICSRLRNSLLYVMKMTQEVIDKIGSGVGGAVVVGRLMVYRKFEQL